MTNVPWLWPGSFVTRIVDGDSFAARVTRDLGFHGTATFEQKLRLNRINAQPAKTALGQQATQRFGELVGMTLPGIVSPPLLIETVKAYKYGDEWMAEVTLADGRNVSDVLVAEGLAVFWDGTGPRPGG
jgi:endonuclease YncB( thermonuclease family)